MSRGPGRIERAIEAVLAAEPDNAFTTADLCLRVYPDAEQIEKRHRVAVLRAMANIMERRDVLGELKASLMGGASVFYDRTNVLSYAMARMKTDRRYQDNNPWRWDRDGVSESRLREMLTKDRESALMREGGAWWRHTQSAVAEIEARRAGDTARLERVLAERESEALARREGLMIALRGMP